MCELGQQQGDLFYSFLPPVSPVLTENTRTEVVLERESYFLFSVFFNPHLRICFMEGAERERDIDVREKHRWVASHTCPED